MLVYLTVQVSDATLVHMSETQVPTVDRGKAFDDSATDQEVVDHQIPVEIQVGWLCYGAGNNPQLENLDHPCKAKGRIPVYMKAIRLEDASGEGLYLEQDVSDLIEKYQSNDK